MGMALSACAALQAAPPSQFSSRGPGGGGALFAPSFSPYHAGEMFLACDMSELFHTTNYGAAWSVVDFRQIQGGRQAIVNFTGNPSVLYAIDLTSIDGGDTMTPSQSLDGGNTWQRLPGDPTGGGAFALFADPNSTNRLLVSDYTQIYFSTNGGANFTTNFTNAPMSGNGCFVSGAFFDGPNIYAGTSAGLVVSTNGGKTFALSTAGGIPASQAMVSFAGAKQGGTTRFYCVTLNAGDVYPGMDIEGYYDSYLSVYTLDWGQANWVVKTNGIAAGDEPVFVATALNDVSTAYIAGQQDSSENPILYKTSNAGANWQMSLLVTNNLNVFTGWAGYGGDRGWSYGAGALGLAVAPNDSTKVIYTDLGFSHLTTNGGAFWKQVYVNPADENPTNAPTPTGRDYHSVGLENTSCWNIAWADSNHLVTGYSDIKGVISADAGNSWSFGYTGDNFNSMYYCLKHPATGVLYAATSSIHDMYESTHLTDATIDSGTGEIFYSLNQGVTWQALYNAGHPVIWLAADPNNTNRLYASVINSSSGGIYVSTNIQSGGSSTWTKLPAPAARTQGHPFNVLVLKDGTLVCTYSGRINPSGSFTPSSGVFVSTNAGTSWIDRTYTNMSYWTKDLVLDPNDPSQNTWYVGVFSGWGGPPNGLGGLYRTTNRGLSWTWLTNLDRVTSCAFNPLNTNELYLTTETDGLWYSENIHTGAPSFTQCASYPFRQPERVFFNPFEPSEMWVVSFGHGLMVGSTASLPGTLQLSAATLKQSGIVTLTLQPVTPGESYALLGSTNLSNWTSLATNLAGSNGVVQFTDTNAGGLSRRFYLGQGL
jgi:hypothetical protein